MERENNFALIHLLAACMVMFGHMFALLQTGAPVILGSDVHGLGVNILFLVSGYLVAKSYARSRKPGRFYLKRFLRIFPPLAVCVTVSAAALALLTTADLNIYIRGAWLYIRNNLLMRPKFDLPGVFADNPYPGSVNGSLWTLPIELVCFLLLPIWIWILGKLKKGRSAAAFGLSLFAAACAVLLEKRHSTAMLVFWATDWLRSARLGAYFLSGAAFSTLSEEKLRRVCRSEAAILILVLALCFGSYYPAYFNYALIPYVVISFAISRQGVLRSFCSRHDYAYGLYLWAFPVQQAVIQMLNVRAGLQVGPIACFAVVFPIVALLGALQHRFVEAPMSIFLNMILARFPKSKTPSAG